MRRIPNFVLLRAFEAAARLESFALAAQELHRTPSAISHQIRELEQYFGCPLFLRANRRVEPTPQARRLLDSLSRVFDVVEAACQEVALAPQAQVLAVHCSPSLATQWLGPRLADFARAHADVAIRLSTGAEPLDLSRVREVDVAISYGHALERAELQTWPLGTERIAPLCAPRLLQDDPSPRSNQRRVAELVSRLPLIESQLSPVNWSEWFGACGLQPRAGIRASFDRAALGISAAVDGMHKPGDDWHREVFVEIGGLLGSAGAGAAGSFLSIIVIGGTVFIFKSPALSVAVGTGAISATAHAIDGGDFYGKLVAGKIYDQVAHLMKR